MSGGTALLIVDVQVDMFDPSHAVSGGAGEPDEPGTPGWEIHPALRPVPNDLVVDKSSGDAFAGTPLDDALTKMGVARVVIAGLQSEYCIRDTTNGALARGYEVVLVSDGHSTYDEGGRTAQEIRAAVNEEMNGRVRLARAAEILEPA